MSSPAPLSLGSPLVLPCGVVLPNRMVKAAMTETMADPSTQAPNENHFRLYRAWSEGGIGTSLTGNVMGRALEAQAMDRRYCEAPGNVVLESDAHLAAFEAYARAIKEPGAVAIMQLSHPGRQCPMAVSSTSLAPSDLALALPGMPAFLSPVATPRAMDAADIDDVKRRFARSAELAVKAGFDGVQVHAAHGYLLSSFLSPLVNQRTDAYGGNAVNRRRLLLEIIALTRAAIGPKKVLGVKLNSADFAKGGFPESESMEVIRALVDVGVDFIEVSGGTYENAVMMKSKDAAKRDAASDGAHRDVSGASAAAPRESTVRREAYFLDFCSAVRKTVPNAVLMCSGGWRSGIAMSHAIRDRKVELIGMARPLCAMPSFPRMLLNSPQLQDLDSAVEDAVTLPAYSLALHTPFDSVNKTGEAALENFLHQRMMRGIAENGQPDLKNALSTWATVHALTVTFARMYIYEPRRHPKRAALYATLAFSGLALAAACRFSQQDPKQLGQSVVKMVSDAWTAYTRK